MTDSSGGSRPSLDASNIDFGSLGLDCTVLEISPESDYTTGRGQDSLYPSGEDGTSITILHYNGTDGHFSELHQSSSPISVSQDFGVHQDLKVTLEIETHVLKADAEHTYAGAVTKEKIRAYWMQLKDFIEHDPRCQHLVLSSEASNFWDVKDWETDRLSCNSTTKIYQAYAIRTIARLILEWTISSDKHNRRAMYKRSRPAFGRMPPRDICDIEKEWLDQLTTIQNLWIRLRRHWELLPTKVREGREQNKRTQRMSRAARKASEQRLNRDGFHITASDSGTSFEPTDTIQQDALMDDKPNDPIVKETEVLGLQSHSSSSENSLPSFHVTSWVIPGGYRPEVIGSETSAYENTALLQQRFDRSQTVTVSRLPKHVLAPSDILAIFGASPPGIYRTGKSNAEEEQLRDIANMLAIPAVDIAYLEAVVLPLCRRYPHLDRGKRLIVVMGYVYLAKWGREGSKVETMSQLMVPENEEEAEIFLKSWLDMGEQWLRDDWPVASMSTGGSQENA